jgi:hypothetical protein
MANRLPETAAAKPAGAGGRIVRAARSFLALLFLVSLPLHAQYYQVNSSAGVATAFPWVDISATGTTVALADDSMSALINIGFTFNFGGANFTQVRIGSNGNLQFPATNNTAFANTDFPIAFNQVMAPFWDDFNPNSVATRVRYQTLGSAPNRSFVVSWLGVPHYCSGGTGCATNQTSALYTFQVQIYENGNFVYSYQTMPTGGGNWTNGTYTDTGATIGYQGLANTDWQRFSYLTNSVVAGTTILFYRLDHFAISPSSLTGTTCTPLNVTITAHNAAHAVVYPAATTSMTLATSTAHGDWVVVTAGGTLNNGAAGDGAATYTWSGSETAITLSFTDAFVETTNINLSATVSTTPNGSTRSATEMSGTAAADSPADPNLTFSACVVPSSFNACELTSPRCTPPTVGYDRLYTKLAAAAFNIDMVALQSGGSLQTGFSNSVTVDLIANSTTGVALAANNCPVSQTAVIPLGSVSFTSGRGPALGVGVGAAAFSGVAPNYGAYRDVRVRFTCSAANCPPSGVTACSTDNFAVRPQSFAVTSTNATQTGTSGLPTLKAGSAAFNLTATAVPGYNGTPSVVNSNVVGTPTAGSISGVFGAAPVATGAASGSSFTYNEVGNFGLNADAVLDSSYSSVDGATDCVSGSTSNSLTSGKYGCSVGSGAVPQSTGASGFGRFTPDHFSLSTVTISTRTDMAPACSPASTFTYMDEATGLGFTLTAQNSSNGTTQNYQGAYAKLALGTFANLGVGAVSGATNLTPRIGLPPGPSPGSSTSSGTWSLGAANVSANTGILRNPSPDGPFAAMQFGIAPVDTDGVAMGTLDLDVDNNTINDHKSLGIASEVRFGRLNLFPGTGAAFLPLPVPIRTEYWNGTGFVTNTADSCTRLTQANVPLGPYTAPLAACATRVSNGTGAAPPQTISFTNGIGRMQLDAPGIASYGSVVLTVNLGSSALGAYCQTVGGGTTADTGAARSYLQGAWNGSATYDKNPAARAAFGVYGTQPAPLIFYRENY